MMPLSARKVGQRLADRLLLPAQALVVGRDQARHQADIGFRQFAAGIGQGIEADIERAFAHRRELRVGLDQRGVRIDFGGDFAAAAFGDFLGEHPAQAVAEIALVDGAAGKLVRDFQRRCGVGGAGAEAQDGGRGKRGCEDVAACEHGFSPEILFLIGAFKAGVERSLAGLRAKFLSSDSSRPCVGGKCCLQSRHCCSAHSEREGFAEDSVNNASNRVLRSDRRSPPPGRLQLSVMPVTMRIAVASLGERQTSLQKIDPTRMTNP